MATILTQGIGGSFVNPASTSLNGVVPHVQIPQLSSGSGSGSGNILSTIGSITSIRSQINSASGSKYIGKNELNPEAELICDLIEVIS